MTAVAPPYVTAWTGETGYVVRPLPWMRTMGGLYAREGQRGQGEPRWGVLSEERQRECVVERRCQVCRGKLRDGIGVNMVTPLELRLLGRPTMTEPLTCIACAKQALVRCPSVREQVSQGSALLAIVTSSTMALQVIGLDHPDPDVVDALDEAGVSLAVAMCYLVLLDWREVTVDEVLRS